MSEIFINNLSFTFVMDLYRLRINAEKRKDKKALLDLQQRYPELFTEDFDDFIEKLKMTAQYLDQKYDSHFSDMFEVNQYKESESIH